MENIDEAMEIFIKHYKQWVEDPTRMDNGYNYESSYTHIMQNMLKEIFQHSLGETPNNRNKKKR